MRVLLLNLYYPPDTSATAKMAETVALALCGQHSVTLICGRPSYDPTERRSWKFFRNETQRGVDVIRVGSTDYPRKEMKKRIFNYLSYVLLSVPRAIFVPCDVVLAMTDPPFEGIVGAWVALLKGKPFVYNIRDMYPDMAVGSSIVEPGLMSRIWEKLHRWALRRAAVVVVLGEDMRNRIVSKGISPERVCVVRDGADISGSQASPDPEVVRTIRGSFRFVLLHAGNLGFYGAWQTLLDAARKLSDHGIGLVFVGDGAQRSALQTAAKEIPNVHFLPFFPAAKVPSVLAAADAHVITVKRGLEGVVVPSKMYGILAAGKPIVAVAPEQCDVVSLGLTSGFAICADPDDPESLAARVLELSRNPTVLFKMGEAARVAATGYQREDELRKLAGIVESAGTA